MFSPATLQLRADCLFFLFVFKTSQFVVGIFCQCHYTVRIEFMFHRCQSSCVIVYFRCRPISGSVIWFESHVRDYRSTLHCKDKREWNCLPVWLSGYLSKSFSTCRITGIVTSFGIVFEVCIRRSRYAVGTHKSIVIIVADVQHCGVYKGNTR